MVSFVSMTRLLAGGLGLHGFTFPAFVPAAFHRLFLFVPCYAGSYIGIEVHR